MGLRWLSVLVGLALPVTASPGPPDDRPPLRDRETAAMLAADKPEDLARSYHELFIKAGDDRLCGLLSHANCGVALAAGWERMRRTIPKGGGQEPVRPEPSAVARFLGLVEGCLQMPVPPVWEATIPSLSAYGPENVGFRSPDEARIKAVVHGDNADRLGTVEFRQEGTRCLVLLGNDKWSLPAKVAPDKVLVELTRQTAYVAAYDSCSGPFRLYAVERDSGTVRWIGRVWAGGDLLGNTYPNWHHVDLRVRGNEIVVFGVADHTAYIEAFDAGTGNSLWRFASSYFEYQER